MKMYCFCKYEKEVSETEALEILKKNKRINLKLDTGEVILLDTMVVAKIGVNQMVPILTKPSERSLLTLHYPQVDLRACEHCGRIIAIE